MEVQVLIKIKIINLNIDEITKQFPIMEKYLSRYKINNEGIFVSSARIRCDNGKKYGIVEDSIDLRNTLLDWSFNNALEANKFFTIHPEGFQFEYHY